MCYAFDLVSLHLMSHRVCVLVLPTTSLLVIALSTMPLVVAFAPQTGFLSFFPFDP